MTREKQELSSRISSSDHDRKKNNYSGWGIALGASLGFIFSLILDWNMGFGIGIGVAIGLIVGSILDVRQSST